MTVAKGDLIKQIAASTRRTEGEAESALNDVLNAITDNLRHNEKVQLTGFGTFEVKDIPMRTVRAIRGPNAGRTITVQPHRRPRFRAGDGLKKAVN